MTVSLSPVGGAASQFFNAGGVPLYGGKIYTYEAGTTTPKATYTEANGLTTHPNPIILDSAGRVPGGEIWLTSAQAYLFILKTSSEELIGTYDNLYGIAAGAENAVTEVQIATAGQTDFVLTSMAYTPGVFTLGVYIDGVNQVVNNSYTETSATTVTFVSGLHVGAVVKFININSAATDSNVVSYLPAGTGAVATTVQAKLRITASEAGVVGLESTQPCYAAVSVNFTRTTLDRHAFEDWSTLASTDTGLGYASFDSKPTLTNTQPQSHFVGYQSRGTFNGAYSLTDYWHAYDTQLSHTGTGVVAEACGLHVRAIGGAGPITTNYGIYLANIARGTTNWAIFSAGGNSFHSGKLSVGGPGLAAPAFKLDVQGTVGDAIRYTDGTVNAIMGTATGAELFGTVSNHPIYFITNGIARMALFPTSNLTVGGTTDDGVNRLQVTGGIASTLGIKPGSFPFASLPPGIVGQTIYCTNGRKVGEGAGAGTGVPVYYSNGAWRVFSTDAVVAA